MQPLMYSDVGECRDNKTKNCMNNDLQKLFLSELNGIYQGEEQLADAASEFEKNSTSTQLKDAFREHSDQAKSHSSRLEQVFRELGQSPGRKTCHGIAGIVREAQMIAADFDNDPALDALLIASAQKAGHYEISAYGTLCTWAEELGQEEGVLEPLQQNLNDSKEADIKLTRLAELSQNLKAKQAVAKATSSGLQRAFVRELREIYDAENLLVSTLAEVAYYADSRVVKLAAGHHRSQTEKHAERLQKVFGDIDEIIDRKPCAGMEGIIDDAQVTVEEFLGNTALDAAMIAAAQKAEHYEITTYGTLCTWARELGYQNTLSLLENNLSDEKQTDHILSLAAELLRNAKAKRHDSVKRSSELGEFVKLATHAQ
jgi:ferritin-like metal-binding protein YciE